VVDIAIDAILSDLRPIFAPGTRGNLENKTPRTR
jgi:hypothetical protein